MTSVDVNWAPPPCWLAPAYGAKAFKDALINHYYDTDLGQPKYHQPSINEYLDHHAKNGGLGGSGSGYTDFNVAQDGKGMFWIPVGNPNVPDTDMAKSQCMSTFPFWVPKGTTPNVKNAISPKILSQLAYAHTNVPGTDVSMNPAGTQTVNLPTWIWLSGKDYKAVSVKASVPDGNGGTIWAQTTAAPVRAHIDPGTPDATVFPAGGDCAINEDGSVGTPYTAGVPGDPPCGVTYLRSTTNTGPYQLKVTVTWQVNWTGSGNTGGQLPDGVYGAPQDVTVREIQTVNR